MGRPAKKVSGYIPTLQCKPEAKNLLVEWLDKHNKPEQGVIVSKALMFCLNAPEEIQAFIFYGVPASLKGAYAACIRKIADEIDHGMTAELGAIPPDIFVSLGELAKADDVELGEYLRRHVNARTSARVTRPASEDRAAEAAGPRAAGRAARR